MENNEKTNQQQPPKPAQQPMSDEMAMIKAKAEAQFMLTQTGLEMKEFEIMQRKGTMYAQSTIVPKTYQGNVGNCIIAVDMASRMMCNPLMVMQNLYIVNGIPSWATKFLIATLNATKKFTPLNYVMGGEKGTDTWSCRAVAIRLFDKKECLGPEVTIKMAKDEGWYDKPGSKWKTIPELMLMYRAAAFFQRLYAPEVGMGLMTYEEVQDGGAKTIDITYEEVNAKANQENLEVDTETGEIKDNQNINNGGDSDIPPLEEKLD